MHHRTEQEIMQNWKGNLDRPVVSVCCPTYNHESYIAEAIDGFLIQETDFPFEVLINDDCSTDETAQIIRDYEKKYPNIIKPIYQNENQYSKGIKPNPTFNFPRAKGKYIALCEGDDYWTDPTKLKKQAVFLQDNSEYILVFHKTIKVDRSNELLSEEVDATFCDISQDALKCAEKYIQTCTAMFLNGPLDYNRNLLQAYSGDAVLWHLLSFKGKNKYLDSIRYSAYRIHDNGIWSKLSRNERFLNSTITKLRLLENLECDQYLQKRLENTILRNISGRLLESIKHADTNLLKALISLALGERNIKISKLSVVFIINIKFLLVSKIKNNKFLLRGRSQDQ